ncbi:MAG: hypothetical protein OEU36_07370 [Gammaproteobacteria bacterium]|nr:hypothetical protein [Gammaproteobacteria bacterium]
MNNLLSYPEVQSVLLPFVVSLTSGLILKRWGWCWAGIGVLLGYLVATLPLNGFQFVPLTGTRKVIVLALAAGIFGLVIDPLQLKTRLRFTMFFAIGALAIAWIIWPVVSRKETLEMSALLAGGLVYCGWLAASLELLRQDSLRVASATVALGAGTGLAATLGATALLGQMGISVAAASGACLIIVVFSARNTADTVLTFAVGLVLGLLGYVAFVFARLPWFALLPLALVPVVARLPLPQRLPRILQAVATTAVASLPAIVAVLSVYFSTEQSY